MKGDSNPVVSLVYASPQSQVQLKLNLARIRQYCIRSSDTNKNTVNEDYPNTSHPNGFLINLKYQLDSKNNMVQRH